MAKMTVPSDAEQSPFLQAGVYGNQEPVRIASAKLSNVAGRDDSSEGQFLDIRVGVPSKQGLVFVGTSRRYRDHTQLTSNTGSKAAQFLRSLGFSDPTGTGFDLDGLPGMEVLVEVGYRSYEKDGVTRHTNWIVNISRKA